ncbi:MAG TPA: hypothetical protein VFL60_00665 [Gaiellaceae bacterium]|nr:hypothetical protein [Gaiellaceae bacterium]
MRRYGLYDGTRGLTTLVAAGVAGLLLWVATLVGVQTVDRFWAAMGIVAGAGLVMGLAQVVAGWTKGGRLRISPLTFLLGFLPVLVCVGWILMATQPGHGWHEGTVASWSRSIGIMGLVHDLGLWHGVLAFGIGLVLGMTFDTVLLPEREVVRDEETMVADRRGSRRPLRRADTRDDVYDDGYAADEPVTAERETAPAGEPRTAVVGPRRRVDEPVDDRVEH